MKINSNPEIWKCMFNEVKDTVYISFYKIMHTKSDYVLISEISESLSIGVVDTLLEMQTVM